MNINKHIIDENNRIKLTINNMQQYIEDFQKRYEATVNDYSKKISFVENDLEEYKRREDMFTN